MGPTNAGKTSLAKVRAERLGLSSERLDRIGAFFEGEVAQGRVPGAVALVARRGQTAYWECFGRRDPGRADAMAKDDIFRIQSMTKPILSVGLMMLHEQGRFTLDEPAAKYLPALADMKVAVPRAGAGAADLTLVPAARPITIHDLLRHTSGFTYGLRNTHVQRFYKELEAKRLDLTNEELVATLGQMPLAYQPGSTWEYGNSSEVIGYLIEVLSGQTLGDYFNRHIFRPLGMADTGFWLRQDQMARMAEPGADPATGARQVLQDHRTPRKLERGGGGLISTAPDYLRFAQMLLNGGELDGTRLIGPRTLAWMTSDHLGAIPKGNDFYAGPGYGFGLGFAVRTEAGQSFVPSSVGEYHWWGWAGTAFWVDPKEDLIGIVMFQSPALNRDYPRRFRALVMQAIVD